jgi:hypothetical protein
MRKRTWEAVRWPWGWKRMLTFEGGGSESRYVENSFGGGFGPVVRQNTMNEYHVDQVIRMRLARYVGRMEEK